MYNVRKFETVKEFEDDIKDFLAKEFNLDIAKCPKKDLIYAALTTSSYFEEHKDLKPKDEGAETDYERLEHIGDKSLELSMKGCLFFHLPHLSEGKMSAITQILATDNYIPLILSQAGVDLVPHIRAGNGFKNELLEGSSAIADCMEALAGALYFNDQQECLNKFVKRVFIDPNQALISKISGMSEKKATECKEEHSQMKNIDWN